MVIAYLIFFFGMSKVKELINETDNVVAGFKKDIDTFMDFIDELGGKL